MSKTLGNYVGITEPPGDMYGKLMSIPDSLMLRYLTLVTRLPEDEIREIAQGLPAGRIHPMEAKKRLAWTVTAQYHGEAAAREAEVTFVRVVQEGQEPEKIEEIRLATPYEGEPVWKVVVMAGLVQSHSEARRHIQQGAVELDGQRVSDPNATVRASALTTHLLRVGKRRFKRFVLERQGA
jgi:tyrosyl-tRNA synthetase